MQDTTTGLVTEVAAALQDLLSQPQPCVARASILLGVLQARMFNSSSTDGNWQQMAVTESMVKFQQLLVAPAATKLAKCKTTQDKIVAIAKVLRGKLAKAPAHKQPLHTQYLPSALRDSGKRQLDCLGIATCVLAMCHQIAQQHPSQHQDLGAAVMVVSDDHCWLGVPKHSSSEAAAATGAGDPGSSQQQQEPQQQQQELVYVEVTDPSLLTPAQMDGSWLYAGGHGTVCTAQQVLMVLVAGLMPEELQEEDAAQRLREVQLQLLGQLAGAQPAALLYSNFFRWGMALEEDELQQLADTAEAAAASGDMAALLALAQLPTASLQSQSHYQTSMQRSNGWLWHPASCAAFGWLNRMQAALCGNTDDLLCLSQQQQEQQQVAGVKPWLDVAVVLLNQALKAVQSCTVVLQKYSGYAGKPNKAADTQLLEAVRDLWQNLADANKAVAALEQLHALQLQSQQQQQPEQQQQEQQPPEQQPGQAGPAGSKHAANADGAPEPQAKLQPPNGEQPGQQQQQQGQAQVQDQQEPVQQHVQHSEGADPHPDSQQSLAGHAAADVPAAAAVPHQTVYLASAVNKADLSFIGVLSNSGWLQVQLQFLDALLCFFGEDSADIPAAAVSDFVTVAAAYTSDTRAQAVAGAVEQQLVHSSRVQGLVANAVWLGVEPGLQQLLQLPGTRSRKRQRKE